VKCSTSFCVVSWQAEILSDIPTLEAQQEFPTSLQADLCQIHYLRKLQTDSRRKERSLGRQTATHASGSWESHIDVPRAVIHQAVWRAVEPTAITRPCRKCSNLLPWIHCYADPAIRQGCYSFEVITRQLITTFLPFDTGRLLINLSALNGGGQCYTMLYKYLKYILSIIEVHTRL
jgi:hypothetical protein